MSVRDSGGRFRNHNKPTVLSGDLLRARWVESEATRLKREGLSYEEIAEQIRQVGLGQKVPVTSLPEGERAGQGRARPASPSERTLEVRGSRRLAGYVS